MRTAAPYPIYSATVSIMLLCLLLSCSPSPGKQEPANKTETSREGQPPATTTDLPQRRDTAGLSPLTERDNMVTPEEIIQHIREVYRAINGARLTQQQFPWEASDCGKGTVTYYLLNGEIVKIVVEGSADGYWRKESYYEHGQLVFCFARETSVSLLSSQGNDTFETRTYIYQNKVVKYMGDQDTLPCRTCSYDTDSPEYKLLEAFTTGEYSDAVCR